jgi:hypothetical protein
MVGISRTLVRLAQVPLAAALEETTEVVLDGEVLEDGVVDVGWTVPELATAPGMHCEYHLSIRR